jgi:hypothetical protein
MEGWASRTWKLLVELFGCDGNGSDGQSKIAPGLELKPLVMKATEIFLQPAQQL